MGYAPIAPGTFGTLVGVPIAWLGAGLPLWIWTAIVIAAIAAACALNHIAGKIYKVSDAQTIVLDEVVGYMVTMWAVPWTEWAAVVGFALFRLFDVWKPWPARHFDRKVHNGFGVTMDDIAAGAYACGVLHLIQTFVTCG